MSTACFQLSGEAFTRIVRDLVRDGEWRRALDLVTGNLEGADEGAAFAVLRGDKRFEGVNEFTLEDEDPAVSAGVRRDQAWQYAGRIRAKTPNGRAVYMEPYAWVSSWGPGDVHEVAYRDNLYAPELVHRQGATIRYAGEARAVFYMDDPVRDRAVLVSHPDFRDGSAVVLWRDCPNDPPPWVETLPADRADLSYEDRRSARLVAGLTGGNLYRSAWDRAYAAFVDAGGDVEERGWNWFCEREPGEAERYRSYYTTKTADGSARKPPAEAADEGKPVWEGAKQLIQGLAVDAGIDPEAAAGMAAVMSGESDAKQLLPDKEFAAEYGWVLPDGRYYGCLYFEHKTLASRLMAEAGVDDGGDPDKTAGRLNWVKIHRAPFNDWPEVTPCGSRTTEAQRDAVGRWAAKHGRWTAVPDWEAFV